MEITLSLPDELVARAGTLATRSGRKVEEVLRDTLSLTFSSIGNQSGQAKPWTERADAEVLQLCELELADRDDKQLSHLLGKQREGELSASERTQLTALMRRYEDGLLLKAEALHEAVSRGLKPSLDRCEP